MSEVRITFCGGPGTPTGSNFLLQVDNIKILIDCGLYQGERMAEAENYKNFSYNPKDIDYLFVTHGHLDHVGRIPKLVRDGFAGKIYSTPMTRDIAELIMFDSMGVLQKEALRDGLNNLYEEKDVLESMRLWSTKNYHQEILLEKNSKNKNLEIKIRFLDSGHILGSAMIEFTIQNKKILFTGDLGNSPSPLLKDTEIIKNIDYLIMESVYGDRNHFDQNHRLDILKHTIKNSIAKKGVLMIPTFSIERTQEMLLAFNNMVENHEIPVIPVYLDSPLGINITKVYKKYEKDFNENVEKIIKKGDDIFAFAGLQMTRTPEESKKINNSSNPKIIIAGSGMSNGGRIVHHEKRYLSDIKNTLLLIGYQAAGSLGRKLQDGLKKVFIHGQEIAVRAEIVQISGFSAHKDSDHLIDFVSSTITTLKKVFVVLGEPKSQNFLAQKLIDIYNLDVKVPEKEESVYLEV